MSKTIFIFEKNKKYLNVPLFYGNIDDKKKKKIWQLHLELNSAKI